MTPPQTYPYIYALLFTDLSTDVCTGIEVHWSNEVHKTTETAAITYRFCSLAKHVAGTEVGDDTWVKIHITSHTSSL